jgi:hypothetical protein
MDNTYNTPYTQELRSGEEAFSEMKPEDFQNIMASLGPLP